MQCLHPGAACIAGGDNVITSWEIVFSSMPPGEGLNVRAEQAGAAEEDAQRMLATSLSTFQTIKLLLNPH